MKFTVPVPLPNTIPGTDKFTFVSFPPGVPRFRVPTEPTCDAIVRLLVVVTVPPAPMVSVPEPAFPRMGDGPVSLILAPSETKIKLLDELGLLPITKP